MFKKLGLVVAAVSALVLVGCGGGGGDAPVVQAPVVQPVIKVVNVGNCSAALGEPTVGAFNQYSVLNSIYNVTNVNNPSSCITGTINADGFAGVFDWQFETTAFTSKSYPEIAFGWKPNSMQASNTAKLPVLATQVDNIQASGEVATTCVDNSPCYFSNTFDLWFSKTNKPISWSPHDIGSVSEMMIWTATNTMRSGRNGFVERVVIDGKAFDLYREIITPPVEVGGGSSWNYIAFIAVEDMGAFNINIKSFVNEAVRRGFLKADDYLNSVEYGTEVFQGKGKTLVSKYTIG